MTVIELVNETVEYYKNHERGVNLNSNGLSSGCVYLSEAGNKCAVGRCFNDLGVEELGAHGGDISDVEDDLDEGNAYTHNNLDDYMKLKYKGINPGIWSNLQLLHDGQTYWRKYKTKKGYALTVDGKEFIKRNFVKYEHR